MFKYLFTTTWKQKKEDWKEFKEAERKYEHAVDELSAKKSALTTYLDPIGKQPECSSCFLNFFTYGLQGNSEVLTGKCPSFDDVKACENVQCTYQAKHQVYLENLAKVESLKKAYKSFWINKFTRKR